MGSLIRESFDYGFLARHNRPVNLSGESNDLGHNEVQLMLHFLLIFADLVATTDQHWGLPRYKHKFFKETAQII